MCFDSTITKYVKLKTKHTLRYRKFKNVHDLSEYKRLRILIKQHIEIAYVNEKGLNFHSFQRKKIISDEWVIRNQ